MTESRRLLVVDLTKGASYVEELAIPGSLGLGGKVLGAHVLERYLGPEIAPLSPENVVLLTPSRLSAYAVPGTNRFGAYTRSPLTGIWLECYCGGSFARLFQETGWDGVLITGVAATPVHLHISSEGAEIRSAASLWGRDTFAVEDELLASLGRRSAVLSIGAAGENLVKIASVMHEHAHALGRGGLGAVFGSKRLKAVSVTSPGPSKATPGEQFAATRSEISRLAVESPATLNYRLFGTPAMVALANEAGAFPTDFFTKGTATHRATLEAEHWAEWATIESDTCVPCQLRCRKRLLVTSGPQAGRELHAPEYETIYAFGGSCLVKHALEVAELNESCNRLGLDTMSGGNLVAVAIKAQEAGRTSGAPTAGDTPGIARLLEEIATRSTPLGDLLAEGMDSALAALDMRDLSVTSKHLDPAGYEPRRLRGMALSYALSVRGACHLRATFYKPDMGGLLAGLDDEAYVRTYIDWEDRLVLMDSLTFCRFYRDLLDWDRLRSAVEQLSGRSVTKEDLEAIARETITRIRRLNFALGCTPADDTVAERFFQEPTDRAPALDRAELERRVRLYWHLRGWGEEGYPPPAD